MTEKAIERFRRVEALFDAALEYPPGARREAFLRDSESVEAALIARIRQLLEAHERVCASAPALPEEFPQFGAWRAIRLLGRGGMGTVYLAERADGAFQKTAAVKVVPLALASADIEERFRRERQFLASLDHPKIARLIDGGMTATGLPYLVMEFVDGLAIDRYCDALRLDARARIGLMRQVLEALIYVHERKVIHRDLKSSNILVDASGNAKLLDFGTARLVDASGDAAITRTGVFAFTPECASPEQLQGEPLTFASDVYSAGVLMYRLLTGRPPYRFTNDSLAKFAHTIDHTEPEASGLDAPLDSILHTALHRRLEQRYSSAAEMDADLARYLEGKPVRARPPRRLRWIALAAAVVAIAVGAALWFLHPWRAPHPPDSIAVLPFTNANSDQANEYFVSGLAQEFSSELGRLKTLRVASQSAAGQFRKPPRDLRDIGRRLQVSHFLEASVERSGEQINIAVSLERATDGTALWTNTYRRRTADLGTIEADVARRVAATLGLAAPAVKKKHEPPDQAHDYYLRARFEISQSTAEANARAQEDLRRALELDPEYAAAYSDLGGTVWNQNVIGATRPDLAETKKSEQLWQKAVLLDPDLAAAHISLGIYAEQYDWDFKRAEREFQAVLAAGPNSRAQMSYAILCLYLGRRPEAEEHLRIARDLDPVSLGSIHDAALFFQLEGRTADAREEQRKLAAQSPTLLNQTALANYDVRLGKPGAIQSMRKLLQQQPENRLALAWVEVQDGHRDEALRIIRPLEKKYQETQTPNFQFALFYAELDDEPNTVKWLDRSLDAREGGVMSIRIERDFAKMQDTPDFHRLKRRVGVDW